MPATLVVIDMQAAFEAACNPNVVIAVTEQIVAAKQRGGAIILVEYTNCGPSHNGFYRLLKNYPHKSRISKQNDDGSSVIIKTLRRRGFNDQWLRICGVNADCCVCATVNGLLHKLPSSHVDVVKSACGTFSQNFDWRSYIRHANLKLV